MSRPDWCPQWAWDAAQDVLESPFLRYGRSDPAAEEIARALLSAKREGMDEAADVAAETAQLYLNAANESSGDDCRAFEDRSFGAKVAERDIRQKAQEIGK